MKPSHRKDVIIARIIFAVMCLALVAIIAAVVVTISSHRKQAKLEEELKQLQEAQQQQEQETETPTYVVPQPVEEPVEEVHVRATANVNLRAEASTDAEILQLLKQEQRWCLSARKTDGRRLHTMTRQDMSVPILWRLW